MNDGDPVDSWPDTSGNSNTATQTGSARPTFWNNILNGKPAIRFDDLNSQCLNLAIPFPSSPVTYFTVMKYPVGAGHGMVGLGSSSVDASFSPFLYPDGTQYLGVFGNIFPCGSWSGQSGFALFTGGTDGTTYVSLWLNGGLQGTGANIPGTDGPVNVIGRRATNYASGDLVLTGAYSPALSTTDRQGIEEWIANKYFGTTFGRTPINPLTVGGRLGWWEADTLALAAPTVRGATDGLAISESVIRLITGIVPRTATEALSATHSVQAAVIRLVTRTASELLATAETMQRSKVADRTAADALTALLAASRTLVAGRVTTETLAIAEAAAKSYVTTRTATDSLQITELAFKLMEITMYAGMKTDGVLEVTRTEANP